MLHERGRVRIKIKDNTTKTKITVRKYQWCLGYCTVSLCKFVIVCVHFLHRKSVLVPHQGHVPSVWIISCIHRMCTRAGHKGWLVLVCIATTCMLVSNSIFQDIRMPLYLSYIFLLGHYKCYWRRNFTIRCDLSLDDHIRSIIFFYFVSSYGFDLE